MLTDAPSFQGKPEFLTAARDALRAAGDPQGLHAFEPYQVAEARAMGRRLHPAHHGLPSTTHRAKELEDAAFSFGMDVLVEVHNEEELDRASKLKTRLFGINNRDLQGVQDLARQ